jgi:hypothetical protein|tara:strand:+ start:8369 stop:8815 length:447 start_codon:yes stop_codon:yes gene_type:complete
MLAELAAANAAFAIIKKAVMNTGDLAKAGRAISDFVIAKEELQRKGNKKKKRGVRSSDLEEFMALEAIKTKEKELKEFMIYAGRPGLWSDWQKFQGEARKERRVQEELAKRRRAEISEALGLGAAGLLIASMVAGLFAWIAWLKGMFD